MFGQEAPPDECIVTLRIFHQRIVVTPLCVSVLFLAPSVALETIKKWFHSLPDIFTQHLLYVMLSTSLHWEGESGKVEASWISSTFMCFTFEGVLGVFYCTVLAANDISLIFFLISVLFFKSLSSSSAPRMKQSLT